jgi:hypothetical protein
VEAAEEVVAVLHCQHRIVEPDLGNPRYGAEEQIFDAWLSGGGERDAFAFAAQSRCQPENVNLFEGSGRSPGDLLFAVWIRVRSRAYCIESSQWKLSGPRAV